MNMNRMCRFTIPRGNTSRYVYIFDYHGAYYTVTKKVLYANAPYQTISVVKIKTQFIFARFAARHD